MIETVRCLPSCCRPAGEANGKLQGKEVCPGWRMVPGLIILAGSIACIAYCAIKKNYPLIAAPGLCSLCSLYLIYLGYQFKDLQSLQESSKKFEEESEKYAANNRQLKDEVDRLEGTNSELEDKCKNLNTIHENLQSEVSSLHDIQNKQKESLEKQEQAYTRLEEEHQKVTQQEQALRIDIDKLQQALNTEETNLQAICAALQGITDERSELATIKNGFLAILNKINGEEFRKAVEELGNLKGQIQALEPMLEKLHTEIDALSQVKGDFTEQLKAMKEEVEKLQAIAKQLKEETLYAKK